MKLLIFLLIALNVNAAHNPPLGTWNVYNWQRAGYIPSNADGIGELASFPFPTYGPRIPIPAFLTTLGASGDYTGRRLTAVLNVSVSSGSPQFVWGGYNTWNSNGLPANTRLYLSTSAANYDLNLASANPGNYWWSSTGWTVIIATTSATISDTFDPTHWTDAQGHSAADPTYTDSFNYAVSHVAQIGLSLAGGSFYDVGVAVLPNTGTASFHLLNYTAQ